MEIHIPLYSVYKTKKDCLNLNYEEIIKEDFEFPLVKERIGKIIIRTNTDSKDYLDVLYTSNYTSHKNIPLSIGQISKKEIIEFFNDLNNEELNKKIRELYDKFIRQYQIDLRNPTIEEFLKLIETSLLNRGNKK